MKNLMKNICTMIIIICAVALVCIPSYANNVIVNGIDNTGEMLDVLNKTSKESIEASTKESVSLACMTIRQAIAQEMIKDSKYSAKDNTEKIAEQMVKILNDEIATSKEEATWEIEKKSTKGTFVLVYQSERYKELSQDENAKIFYKVVLDKNAVVFNEVKGCPGNGGGEHLYKPEITIEVTCEEDGEIKYTCGYCSDSYTESVKKIGHNYSSTIKSQPTCSTEGELLYVCSNCSDNYIEKIPTGEHNYEERMRTEAACEKDGVIGYRCTVCGEIYTKVIQKAKGHKYEATTKQATCTTSGIKTYKCVRCPETYTKVIAEPLGHNYEESTTENGGKKYTCTNCGHSYTTETTNSNINDNNVVNEKIMDNKVYIGIGIVIFVLITIIIVTNVVGHRE